MRGNKRSIVAVLTILFLMISTMTCFVPPVAADEPTGTPSTTISVSPSNLPQNYAATDMTITDTSVGGVLWDTNASLQIVFVEINPSTQQPIIPPIRDFSPTSVNADTIVFNLAVGLPAGIYEVAVGTPAGERIASTGFSVGETNPPPTTLPLAPTELSAADNDSSNAGVDGRDFTLTWTPSASSDVTQQRIYILPASTAPPTDFSSLTPVASFDNATTSWTGDDSLTQDSASPRASLLAGDYKIYVVAISPGGWNLVSADMTVNVGGEIPELLQVTPPTGIAGQETTGLTINEPVDKDLWSTGESISLQLVAPVTPPDIPQPVTGVVIDNVSMSDTSITFDMTIPSTVIASGYAIEVRKDTQVIATAPFTVMEAYAPYVNASPNPISLAYQGTPDITLSETMANVWTASESNLSIQLSQYVSPGYNNIGNPITPSAVNEQDLVFQLPSGLSEGSYQINVYRGTEKIAHSNIYISPAISVAVTKTISNPSTSGFTLELNPAVIGLVPSDFVLLDGTTPVAITSNPVTTDGGLTYTVPVSLEAGKTYCVNIMKEGYDFGAASDVVTATDRAVISIDNTSVAPGGTTVVTVKVQGIQAPGLAGYDFKIHYDSAVVNLIALTGTSDFPAPTTQFTTTQPNPSTVPGEILVNAVYVEADLNGHPIGKTGDIELFTLTFQALSTTAQVIPITLTVKDFAYADLENILHTINNGSITIGGIAAPSISVNPTMLTEASANDGGLASGEITLTLANGTFAIDIGKPDVSITGLPEGMDYTVSKTSNTTLNVTVTGQALSHDNNDTTLTLIVAQAKVIGAIADITGTIGLDFNSNANPVTPPAPNVTNDDTSNTVTGMAPGMEYNLDGAGYVPYEEAVFNNIDFSGAHTLLVRVAAEGINPAGLVTTLIFTANPVPVTPPAPNVTNDDTSNTVTGMAPGMEYNLDGTGYVPYEEAVFNSIDFSGAHTLLVRVAAEGINPFSADTMLTFTAESPLIVTVANVTGLAGEDIQVSINLQNVQQTLNGTDGLVNANFKILYDSQYLQVNSITPGVLFENASDFSVNTQVPGEIVFLSQDDSIGERLIISDGIYATINFTIKPDTPIGDYLITFADTPKLFNTLKLSNFELTRVIPTTVGSKITVKTFLIGDVNGDNLFDVTDFGYLKLFLLGKITSLPSTYGMNAGNVDGLGTVPDVTDFGYMKLRLLGKIPKFPIE